MTGETWQAWFEAAWAEREERVYPRLFGPLRQEICVLSDEVFLSTFKQSTVDPRWLTYGVFECPPNGRRTSWLYVTSGLSNAWEDDSPQPDGPSGLGMEFVLESSEQGMWPILRLQHLMAFQILIACGRYPNLNLLDVHHRIPLRAPITPAPSELTWLTIAEPVGYESSFQLSTGHVSLLAVVGITESEAAFARERGGDVLLSLLKSNDAFPVTNSARTPVLGAA